MTGDSQDKLRALILSALMVLSVFAGTIALSGAAAASDANNVSATSAVEYNGAVEIVTDTSVNLSDSDISYSIYLDGSDATSGTSVAVTDGQRHVITGAPDILPTQDLTVTVTNTSSGTTLIDNASVTTTAASVDIDASGGSDLTTRQGGDIALNFSANNTFFSVENEDGDQVAGVFASGEDSRTFVLDSENFETGETYTVLIDDNNDEIPETVGGNFSLRPLTLSTTADATDLTTNDALTGEVDSEAGRELTIELLNADDEVVDTKGTTTSGTGTASYDFGTQAAGDYTVEVTDNSTGKTVSTNTITVSQAAQPSVDFAGQNTVDVSQGDIAEITLSVENTDTAYLVIGDDTESGFQANVTVTDGNDDDQVTVEFNTFTAGRYGPEANIVSAAAAADGDSATLTSNTSLSNILAQTDYSLGVSTDKANAQEDPENIGTLFIQTRSTDQMQLWRAGDLSGVSTAEDVAAGVEAGDITQTDTINPDAEDVLIHQVDATGLAGLLANQSSSTATGQFIDALDSGELELSIEQTETNVPNTDPKQLNLSAVDSSALTVIPGEGTYYIALDTSADVLNRGDGVRTLGFEAGENYEVTFTVPEGDLADSDQSVGATFSTSEASSSLDQDTWSFQSADNQSITGTSTYTSGTEVTVRIESDDPNNPLVDRQRVAVQGDGTFEAQFDLSALPEGTNVSIRLSDPSGTAATATGQVASAAAFEVSDLSAPSTAQIGDTVTVTATVTNTGDLEGSTPVEFVFAGQTLDSQNITLAGGASQTVEFNIPVTDEVAAGQTYTHGITAGDGEATAEITIEEAPTPTPTTAEPTTAEPTTAEPTTAEPTTEEPTGTETMGDDGTTTEESGGGQPGFTMGVGIVALLAAALLALRRRN